MILDLDAGKAEAVMTPLLDAPAGSVSIRQEADGIRRGRGAVVVARLCARIAAFRFRRFRDLSMSMLPEAKLDILLAHHASLEAAIAAAS